MTATATRKQLTENLRIAEHFGYDRLATANRRLIAQIDAKESTVASTEDRIIAAIREHAAQPNDLVSLTWIRVAIADVPRTEQDRVLKAMDRARVIQLDTDPNRKVWMTMPEVVDAAVTLGGQLYTLVSLV